jgi:hypothetical protein
MNILFRTVAAFGLALILLKSHVLAQEPGLLALRAELEAAQPKARLAAQWADLVPSVSANRKER